MIITIRGITCKDLADSKLNQINLGNTGEIRLNPTVTSDTDDAVGLPWFVAIVHHKSEKKVRSDLLKAGFDVFVASQPHLSIYPSGRKKWIDRIIIHSKVFIRCSEDDRLKIVNHPLIYRFMTNPSGYLVNGHKPIATIPDSEIQTLKFMLGQSDFPVSFMEADFSPGLKVKVIRGALKGMEGEVIQPSGHNNEVIIHLQFLGSAKVTIPAADIQPIDNQQNTPPNKRKPNHS